MEISRLVRNSFHLKAVDNVFAKSHNEKVKTSVKDLSNNGVH